MNLQSQDNPWGLRRRFNTRGIVHPRRRKAPSRKARPGAALAELSELLRKAPRLRGWETDRSWKIRIFGTASC